MPVDLANSRAFDSVRRTVVSACSEAPFGAHTNNLEVSIVKARGMVGAVAGAIFVVAAGVATAGSAQDAERIARGRYLITIGGCNDCHTPGYMQKGPEVPESEWLIGLPIGFQGPWGTTYPTNLRIVMQSMDETQWLKHARQQRLPPMPWFNLARMTDEDLKAVYAFVHSLGEPGVPAPAYIPPGGKVTTPFYVFVTQTSDSQTPAPGK